MTTPTIVANLRHHVTIGRSCTIGGGIFSPDELREAADLIEAAASEPSRLAMARSQTELATAIGHLRTILNSRRTATQAYECERKARDWLDSLGSEPA